MREVYEGYMSSLSLGLSVGHLVIAISRHGMTWFIIRINSCRRPGLYITSKPPLANVGFYDISLYALGNQAERKALATETAPPARRSPPLNMDNFSA
ncbi:hypothetical protein [Thermopirellula anaerolimosa]